MSEKELPERLYTVCGRRVTTEPVYAYPTVYQGQMIYFCTGFCLEAFEADPDRFYAAHSRNASRLRSEEED